MYIDSLVHIYIHIHKTKAHSLERESQKTESGTKLAYCLYRNRKQVIANIKAFKHVVIEIWALKKNC